MVYVQFQSFVGLFNPFVNIYIFVITLLFVVIFRFLYNNWNLPPGPWGIPIFGYLPFLHSSPLTKIVQLSKKYGNVISLYIGNVLVVILGDYEAVKEAYVKNGANFSGRPDDFIFKVHENEKGLITNEGEEWQKHRRFALSVLRDYGMGKLSLEPKIQEEIRYCLEEFAKHEGKAMDPQNLLGVSVSNNIAALQFGKRYHYTDEAFKILFETVERTHKLLSSLVLKTCFPWINYLPFSDKFTKYSELLKCRSILDGFFRKQIKNHEEKHEVGNREDYIDAYLTHKKELHEKTGHEDVFNQNNLEGNLLQMFAAGSDTVTNTLRWALLYMAIHPDIQKRVQSEIDSIVGSTRLPSVNDRSQMPFTEATLMEIARCGTVVPLSVCHSNPEESFLFGKKIPKRTYIMANIYAIHHDPRHWERPEDFDPQRFIGDNGELKKSEYLIPFGVGKRICIGESLARMELFLYFTALFQRFTVSPPPDSQLSPLKVQLGIVRSPCPFKICATQRTNYEVV